MSKRLGYTPGPWHLNNFAANGEDSITISRSPALGGHSVALVGSSHREDVLLADACLIAAAPELLEALKTLLEASRELDQSATHDGLNNCKTITLARAAIRKAEEGAV